MEYFSHNKEKKYINLKNICFNFILIAKSFGLLLSLFKYKKISKVVNICVDYLEKRSYYVSNIILLAIQSSHNNLKSNF